MKRTILFMALVAFSVSAIAQVSQYKPRAWYETVLQTNKVIDDVPGTAFFTDDNPTVANSRGADVVIGETWYDNQTNSGMGSRLLAWDDGSLSATWIRGMSPTTYADRGTGYNYYNGTSWGAYPTERIEDQRTGWPSIAPYGENGEIVVAHLTTGLYFSWRETKGTGSWNHFTLLGPAEVPDLLWPKMITTGENNDVIHVIASAGNAVEYEGLTNALLYSRSADGGQTWDPQNVILEGMGSDYTSGWGGDDYAWAQPVGETIAFVAFGGIKDGIVMKSTDAGDNWERITFYQSPDPFFDGNGGDLPKCGGGDGYNAVVLDHEGIVHVAFGRQIHLDDTPGDDSWSYYPYSDGLVYWNETMPTLDTAIIQADILPEDWTAMNLYQNGNLAAWTQPNGEDTIVGVATYYASLTSMPQLVALHDEFGNTIIQLFYSALAIGFDNSEYNYRHIWGRFTEGDGIFSAYTDYTGDVFHIFSECVYPAVAQKSNDNFFHFIYQTDNMPGNSIQPTDGPMHDPILNNIGYLTVPHPELIGIEEQNSLSLQVSANYPNPFSGQTYVEVELDQSADIALQVFSVTGQQVMAKQYGHYTAGSHLLTIDGSLLTKGVYFYTIQAMGQTHSGKMLVN